ncbi:Gfo/Idh/MocA family oxidoreductase [Solirubrobacter ginsenosidimutans]|uniref:Gfo/Idh/MocA family oxidoreductase n=1 Tax=Solirubrobacter ginsenosidimutans TaxID=490573 RepID=A0A9X3MR49_9ACTN|nr:Gfo/Idh/MocA family oxidoreductase [Solirubrobacter ginsenosidimutans]MDA0161004.1 Gfo/Idh/MocA family oxidoreductase [Solirubrobacter ginsenosidimutans]
MSDLGVGLVGCGKISGIYLDNAPRLDGVRIVACTDVDAERARETAHERAIDACTMDELLAHRDVQVVLCLTPPDFHADVALAAIGAGKHIYTEKPLATSVDDARWVLQSAAAAGVLVGSAPDTFLGAGIQTIKAAIDDGRIGAPAVAQIRLLARPPETWHPSPAFLYAELSGPLMDLGPYAVATAIELFGDVEAVTGLGTRPRTSGVTLDGTEFPIVEPTRVAGVLAHESGVLTTITTTDDANAPARYGVEVHGLDGTLLGGDPNTFDGPVVLARRGELDQTLPLVSEWNENSRGLGLQDLCRAARDGTPQRASGELGLQVLETLLDIRDCALSGV